MLEYIILSYLGLGVFTVLMLGCEAWDVDQSTFKAQFKKNPIVVTMAMLAFVLIWPVLFYQHRNN